MDYELERLGSRNFEHLTQAIAVAEAPAHLNVSVFGAGPDGGREASWQNSIPSGAVNVGLFEGYGVLQAKFHERPGRPNENFAWLARQIQGELARWRSKESKRLKLPDYFLVATNVVLSAYPNSGGVDAINELIKEAVIGLPIRGWHVWHYDEICRLLDGRRGIRAAYAHLITPGDVLSKLHEILTGTASNLGPTIGMQTARSLRDEQWVRLHSGKMRLGDIAIDLPLSLPRSSPLKETAAFALQALVRHGNSVLRPSLACDASARHRVLIGGPGQGKSTVTQLLCQLYRISLLADRSLGPESARVLAQLMQDPAMCALPSPSARRWPVYVSLGAYGDTISGGENFSLLAFIAQSMSEQLGEQFHAHQLRAWLRAWPWLVVLDGLDEVSAPKVRSHLAGRIDDFLDVAAEDDADLFVVATTRPQGYEDGFSTATYEHLTLARLTRAQAERYGKAVASVTQVDDPQGARIIENGLRDALGDDATARLMTTPLQIVVMSTILERKQTMPSDRHALFDTYYETIYEREVAKPGDLAKLLGHHKTDVNHLHERVGAILQERSGRQGGSVAQFPSTELVAILDERLACRDFGEAERARLGDRLRAAAANRLVLLVPGAGDTVQFEVRSLQEYMAARWLATGSDADIEERLLRLVPSLHWSHTWVLAAERLLGGEREYLEGAILGILHSADAESLSAQYTLPGAHRALELLDADIAGTSPRLIKSLVSHAMKLVSLPPGPEHARIARIIHDVSGNQDVREQIFISLDGILRTGDPGLPGGVVALESWRSEPGPLGAKARSWLARLERSGRDDSELFAVLAQLREGNIVNAPISWVRPEHSKTSVKATDYAPCELSAVAEMLPPLRGVKVADRVIPLPIGIDGREVVDRLGRQIIRKQCVDEAARLARVLPTFAWPFGALLGAALREIEMLTEVDSVGWLPR